VDNRVRRRAFRGHRDDSGAATPESFQSSEEIRRIAESDRHRYDESRPERDVAIVVAEPASYGLMRMWQTHYGEGSGAARTRVVTSRQEAYEWVRSKSE
jgi:hypothetical protein